MSNEHSKTMDYQTECCKQNHDQEQNSADWANCCSPRMGEMMKDCACGSAFKSHPLAACAVLGGIILALVISQVGGILGILAFFRSI